MKLLYTREAKERIRKLPPEIKKGIRALLELLPQNLSMGKFLQRELSGYCSLRFKNYRVIYKINGNPKNILIYTLGHRVGVYEDFLKRLKAFH